MNIICIFLCDGWINQINHTNQRKQINQIMDLLKYTFKKREKFAILQKWLNNEMSPSLLCLDLGSAKGVMSKAMRTIEGTWLSADTDWTNVEATRAIVGKNVIRVGPYNLPFKDDSFDRVVLLDFLEHFQDDVKCIQEIHRIMKSCSILIISTPKSGRWLFLNKIKPWLGLTMDKYGHVREGYTAENLRDFLVKADFDVITVKNYSYIFTEAIEMILNCIYVRMQKDNMNKRDGYISPAIQDEYQKHGAAFKIFKIIYPLLWWISRLDCLLKIFGAYAIMFKAKKAGK